jgi:hypothetical protein
VTTATGDIKSSAASSRRSVSYGRVAYPAIGYRMGGRQMVATVMSPVSFVDTVGPRERWDPLTGSGTNRKEDVAHRQGIAQYIQDTPEYVLNSILVYISPEEASFEPDDPDAPISPGVLYTRPGAKFTVGDGGHRTNAFSDVIEAHRHGDAVFDRLMANGQPINVILDDDPARRAQDFTDLQNNSKPLNASIAQSMNRRQSINRILLDRVIKGGDVPLLDGGARVEFLTDSPGKLSGKLLGFKVLRYGSGTLLVGTKYRSTRSWEEAVALACGPGLEDDAYRSIVDFWNGYAALPAVKAALDGEKGIPGLRQSTWLTSANVIYAIAATVHGVCDDTGRGVTEVMAALAPVDFSRSGDTLDRTLVEPAQPDQHIPARPLTGRDAWEGAARVLSERIRASFA